MPDPLLAEPYVTHARAAGLNYISGSQMRQGPGLQLLFEGVASRLRNTATICRKWYIHPEIIACYLEGTFPVVAAAENGREKRAPPRTRR